MCYPLLLCADNGLNKGIAFYYGEHPPIHQLKAYNQIVLDSNSGFNPRTLQSSTRQVYAYVSIGEAERLTQYKKPIQKKWVLSNNPKWQTLILDQSNPDWQHFVIEEIITPLWEKGYRAFFLDTMDSYHLSSKDPKQLKKQEDGLIYTLLAIKTKYPKARIILNRGFEILPQVHSLVDAVVAESLFYGWDNSEKKYVRVSESDRNNLIKELNQVKKMGIPVTVIDYLSPKNSRKAKEVGRLISDLGFNPWITDSELNQIYLSDEPNEIEPILRSDEPMDEGESVPRKILLLLREVPDTDDKLNLNLFRVIAMPLNYMGYQTILVHINKSLPTISPKEYAGIVVAPGGILQGREQALYQWYLTQIRHKIPLVILSSFGFHPTNPLLCPLGLRVPLFSYTSHSFKTLYQSPMMGFEIEPLINDNFIPVILDQGRSLLKVQNDTGEVFDIAAITPWGGYYLSSDILLDNIAPNSDNTLWTIDPFQFLRQALRIPENRPVPDYTTENGKRLMLIHIDGDGFANKAYNGMFSSELMMQDFLKPYPVPTTVSIIQGELASNGLYPKFSAEFEEIARRIFALPNVEIGSHTFSHPFDWIQAEKDKHKKVNPSILPIPNYQFDLRTEIIGSVDYINQRLAPPGKYCKAFLWSGDGVVQEEALKYTYELGIANINPGTFQTKLNSSISNLSGIGLFQGPYFQMFAPIGNEFESVEEDRIFYSLIRLIHALSLTDKPHRFAPIDIYIHFYAVQQLGGLKALHKVYEWALSQPVMNIYVSEYFNKIMDFNQLKIKKQKDGWLYVGNDELRELRIPISKGYPDLLRSKNVIGYSQYNQDRYIHLGPGGRSLVFLTNEPASEPYLIDANARVTLFRRHGKDIDISFEGHVPLQFTLGNMNQCSVWDGENQIESKSTNKIHDQHFEMKKGARYDLAIHCQ